jgi:PP-loop superfamily ATP-utilizing enzyme
MRMLLARRREISLKMRALGFAYAALDLAGYAMGAMNRREGWKRAQ